MVRSSRCYQSNLLELRPHFWQLSDRPFFFFLFFRQTDWALHCHTLVEKKDSLLHIPDDISLTTLYSPSCMMTNSVPSTVLKQLSNFTSFRKKKTPVFTKDWMNNVASLLTYCSICWLGNNLTWSINSSKGEEFMHSRDLLDVIFLLGSFQVKNNIQRVHERHGLVWLIKKRDIPKRNALNTNSAYEINHRCTVFNTHTIAPCSSLALV